jgi:hypothetical protein
MNLIIPLYKDTISVELLSNCITRVSSLKSNFNLIISTNTSDFNSTIETTLKKLKQKADIILIAESSYCEMIDSVLNKYTQINSDEFLILESEILITDTVISELQRVSALHDRHSIVIPRTFYDGIFKIPDSAIAISSNKKSVIKSSLFFKNCR